MIYECSTYCNPHEYLKLPIFFILAILVDVLVVSPCGLTLYFPEREIIGFPVLFGHLSIFLHDVAIHTLFFFIDFCLIVSYRF